MNPSDDNTQLVEPSLPNHLSEIKFSDFDLPPPIQAALADKGYDHSTPIQALTLPHSLQGLDVAGQAQTGTGKTLAFLLSTMDTLLMTESYPWRKPQDPRAVILAPTRELAVQIHQDAMSLNTHAKLKLVVVFGGVDLEKQRSTFDAGCDILIGTPGRMLDFYKRRVFNFHAVDVFVLDEADRMFDVGFIPDIRYIMRRCPPRHCRQNFLFSATLSPRVMELAYEHMNEPVEVKAATTQVTAQRVTQALWHIGNDEKLALLMGLLQRDQPTRAVIFVNTKRAAESVAEYLLKHDCRVGVLSGDVPQDRRLKILQKFTDGSLALLVATDVAARGLHIPEVSHVFNFDLPNDPEDYVHRIGRTGRAGASGIAYSLACESYVFSLPDIETLIGQSIPVMSLDENLLWKEPEITLLSENAEELEDKDFTEDARHVRHHNRHPNAKRKPAGGHAHKKRF